MKTIPFNHRAQGCILSGAVIALALVGCVSTEQLAPLVSPGMVDLGASAGVDAETLTRGRRIYLTACTNCHSPEPIAGYSRERWSVIVPEMSERSGLTSDELSDLTAYVMTARQAAEYAADMPARP